MNPGGDARLPECRGDRRPSVHPHRVDVVDAGRGRFFAQKPNALFIEEGIQEVQVLSSGIGAQYGRFAGGVVNVVTQSGGNLFSGSVRTNLFNSAWSAETPFEESKGTTRASKLSLGAGYFRS